MNGIFVQKLKKGYKAIVIKKTMLTATIAKKMAEASEKKAQELNLKIVISILDDGGNLKYFLRMDGAPYGSIRISQMKANTAVSFPISSRALSEKNAKLENRPYSSIPHIVLLAGGLPIISARWGSYGGIGSQRRHFRSG